jgi:class 3 adenylate cyclase
MAADEIVDVDQEAHDAWRVWWRRSRRLILPALGGLLIIAAVLATIGWTYLKNRDDVLALAADLVANLQSRVAGEVRAYLAPPADAAAMLAATLGADAGEALGMDRLEQVAGEILARRPQISAVLVGWPDGRFLMAQRSVTGSFDTKVIGPVDGVRLSRWYRRDAAGRVVRVESRRDDPYDPRERSWYDGAARQNGPFWTDAYVFFTERRPGVTVAVAARDGDGRPVAVAGIDISLDALSGFVRDLKIGRTGRAMIVDEEGRVLAFPDPDKVVTEVEGQLRSAYVEELGDPLLTRAWDRIRLEGRGGTTMTVDGERYLVAAQPMADQVGRDWLLGFVVPEADFTGFIGANSRTGLWLSAACGLLAAGLAGLLAQQWINAERAAATASARERRLAEQGHALEELATDPGLLDAGEATALRRAAQRVARAAHASGVSVWRLAPDADSLVCLEAYDSESRGHTQGVEVRRGECPALFTALLDGAELSVANAASDARTQALFASYLRPLAISSLLAVPIRAGERVVGSLWLENLSGEGQAADPRSFARAFANLLGLRLAAAVKSGEASEPAPPRRRAVAAVGTAPATGPAPPAGEPLRRSSLMGERERALLRELGRRGVAEGKGGPTVFNALTVLVVRLFDDLALAGSVAERDQTALIEAVVEQVEEAVRRLEIRYVKIMTDQIVAAEGFDGDPRAAAERIGELALDVQASCGRLIGSGARAAFALGIDHGPALGAPVGFGQLAYNLWGDSVRLATAMAATARRGSIQASESAYEELRERFVFRRRGAFYVAPVGEMTTFVLAGRL